jgi:hypothetical protein
MVINWNGVTWSHPGCLEGQGALPSKMRARLPLALSLSHTHTPPDTRARTQRGACVRERHGGLLHATAAAASLNKRQNQSRRRRLQVGAVLPQLLRLLRRTQWRLVSCAPYTAGYTKSALSRAGL